MRRGGVAATLSVRHHAPMKTLLLCAALVLPCTAQAAPVSLGLALTAPELFGLQASLWPTHELTADLRLTLATVDGGLTGHIPVGGDWDGGLHQILVTAYLGYAHNLVAPVRWLPHRGLRIEALAGYGYLNGIDLRIEAGVSVDPGYGAGFAGQVLVGWLL